ncbi:MAG: pilus assembly protein N-terminal domain-containing protein, partial [Desulfobacterales bacterium]|nr:pilus assembly protein N-terminal domain-containing protein [Desulfobacterales bacterium]
MFILMKLNEKKTASFILIALVLLIFSARSWAAGSVLPETREPRKLELVSGKSIILRTSEPIKRISVGLPMIADFILISPREIYIIGNATGSTSLTLWQNKKIFAIYDLEVVYDISRLKQKLHEVLPNEKNLRIFATQDSITLSGRVSSAANLSQAVALAEAYAGYVIKLTEEEETEGERNVREDESTIKKQETEMKDKKTKVTWVRETRKVCNLLQVAGVHQVMLEVRIAEMSKQVLKSIGIDWALNRGGSFGLGTLGALTEQRGFSIASGISSLFFKFDHGRYSWTGFIDLLKQNGLAKILAEPTLIALSGHTANFLAGGEFPIPVTTDDGGIDVDYKEYGVQLAFTPTVLSKDKISIKVAPEVSEIDWSVAVQIGGYPAPGLL